MSKYSKIIKWSEIDNCWLVSVPELAGCIADGKTPKEALDNIEVVICEWIETAKELGRIIPEPEIVNE